MSIKSQIEEKIDTEYQVKQRQTEILIEQQRQIEQLKTQLNEINLKLGKLDKLDKLPQQLDEISTKADEASNLSFFSLICAAVIFTAVIFELWYLWGIPGKIDVINNALYLLLQEK